VAQLVASGIACASVRELDEVAYDAQLRARDMLVELDHPRAGRVAVWGNPLKLSAAPAAEIRPAPALGEHTDSVLSSLLGLSPEELQQLHADGVL
jgi:CoA:oxalate CoA-transferase